MSGLTPQMLAAIQAAGQAGVGAARPGAADTSINAAMNNSLAGSGQFTPDQLAAVNSTWNTSGNWGNGPGDASVWDSQIQNAIQGVLGNQSTVGQFQQPQNTPAQQALTGANGQPPYNPLQPAYLQQPATLNATTVDPSFLSSGLMNSLGSQPTINALVGANQPQFQQQDQQMMQMLATAGLAPSSTAGQTAFNNLAQQQLAGMDPAIASAIQNSQANQLNAGQFNANAGNQSAQFNAGAMNSANAQNLQNQLAQQQFNANTFNQAGNNYFNALTGSYGNNANAFNALNAAGLSGAQGLAGQQASGGTQLAAGQQNTFPTYGGGGFASLGAGLGGYSPSPQQQPNTTNNYFTPQPGFNPSPGSTGTAVNGTNFLYGEP